MINSHFHFDHVGGNALIPNATMLVQRREWEAGMDPDTAMRRGFNPRDCSPLATLAYSTSVGGNSLVLGFISTAMPNRSSKLAT